MTDPLRFVGMAVKGGPETALYGALVRYAVRRADSESVGG